MTLLAGLLVAAPNEVIVRGQRDRETLHPLRSGAATLISPQEATRSDARVHVMNNPSLALPEVGTPSTGIPLPKIRGQDAKASEIWLEDFLFYDPWEGLAFGDDLDLRAFSSLEISAGNSDIRTPSTSPGGGLRYRIRQGSRAHIDVGTRAGAPSGTSTWTKATGTHPTERGNVHPYIFASSHQSNGEYTYFDDNGTPYNEADDFSKTRINNDVTSQQLLPFVALTTEQTSTRVLAWLQRKERGIPGAGRMASTAREESGNELVLADWRRSFNVGGTLLPDQIRIHGAHRSGTRTTTDTQLSLLGAYSRTLTVTTKKGGIDCVWEKERLTALVAVSGGTTVLTHHDDQNLLHAQRDFTNVYTGSRVRIGDAFAVEGKVQQRDSRAKTETHYNEDSLFALAAKGSNGKQPPFRGHTLGLIFERGVMAIYAQQSRALRPPTLLEEFGDGAETLPAPLLTSELARHWEGGFAIRNLGLLEYGSAVYFSDVVTDKIVFIPALGSLSKAVNLTHTKTRGAEVTLELRPFDRLHWNLGATRLWPYDRTRSDRARIIPGTPEIKVSSEIAWVLTPITTRWATRYRSDVYRDPENATVVPTVVIHDCSADTKIGVAEDTQLQIGISVLNVFNVTSVPISSPRGDQHGRVAYSEVNGYPLPGRQWKVDLVASF